MPKFIHLPCGTVPIKDPSWHCTAAASKLTSDSKLHLQLCSRLWLGCCPP